MGRDEILENLQPSLRDLIMFQMYPGLTSWAKSSVPAGLSLEIEFSNTLFSPAPQALRQAINL